MSFVEIFLIAAGLSMDAFAVSVCSSLSMPGATAKRAVITGLYFGVFQAVMPLIGYFTATLFAAQIIAFDHWVAFALLTFIGGKMVISGFLDLRRSKAGSKPAGGPQIGGSHTSGQVSDNSVASLRPAVMLPLAVATSIDALAAGVSFAFLQVNIIASVILIGITTFTLSVLGVKIGNVLGAGFKTASEMLGGIILVLLGVKILLEHLTGLHIV